MINLRQERREHDEAGEPRHFDADEYSRILGDDWVAMGDGTYRYVGDPRSADSARWSDLPLTASENAPGEAESASESTDRGAKRHKKRRWRLH